MNTENRQGGGWAEDRARRTVGQPVDRAELVRQIRSILNPKGALYMGNLGLEVLIDSDTLELVTGSPVRIKAKPVTQTATIPAGGESGQVLAKQSDGNYDVVWVDQTGGSGGGYPLALGYLGW